MNIGNLRHRIELQRIDTLQNETGELQKTYKTYANVWAEIKSGTGEERLFDDHVKSTINLTIAIRYRDGVTSKDRVLYQGTAYKINHVDNVDMKNEMLILACEAMT